MTATVTAHQPDGTQIGASLAVNHDRGMWRDRAGDDGAAKLVVTGITTAQLAPRVQYRLNLDGTPIFAFHRNRPIRRLVDTADLATEVELSGPGLRWILHAGQVYPEDTSDCAEIADERWLGWMSAAFDDSAWPFAVSHGTWRSNPWSTVRPEGWPVPLAQYIWSATGDVAVGDVYFRKQFEVTEDAIYVVCASADDEYRLWIDGVERLSTIGGGRYQWEGFQQVPMRLCPGTHTIAVQGRNLEQPYGLSPAWIMVAVAEAAGDGKPAAANHVSAWSTDAESGTFTVQETSVGTSIVVDVDDTLSDLQAKLDTAVGAGNATVSGAGTAAKNDAYHLHTDASGGTLTITVDGETTSGIAPGASSATVEAEIEALPSITSVTVSGSGTSGSPWHITFDGVHAETSFSVSVDGSGLTGGTATLAQISEGTPYDPWLVEGAGAYANTFMHWYIDDQSALVGGTLTIETETVGSSASSVVRSDTSWTVEAYPTTEPGLTVGEILNILLDEAIARGVTVLGDLSRGFTDTLDSDGNAWGFGMTFRVPLPTDIHRVVEVIEESGGFDVWTDPNFTLQASDERGDDLAVTLEIGTVPFGNPQAASDETALANVVRIRTDEGWVEFEDAASVTARGRWESGLEFEEYRSERGASGAASVALHDIANPQRITSFSVPSEAATRPYEHYKIGDRPLAPVFDTAGFETVRVRVDTIQGTFEDGAVDFDVEVVD